MIITGKTIYDAVEEGVSKAVYPYVLVCTDKAVLNDFSIGSMVEVMERFGVDVVYGDFLEVDHPKTGNTLRIWHDFDINILRHHNFIDMVSLFRKDAFMGMDREVATFTDWAMWLRMANAGKKFQYVPRLIFTNVYQPDSTTGKCKDWAGEWDFVRKKYGRI